jgi:hypothetical protein
MVVFLELTLVLGKKGHKNKKEAGIFSFIAGKNSMYLRYQSSIQTVALLPGKGVAQKNSTSPIGLSSSFVQKKTSVSDPDPH